MGLPIVFLQMGARAVLSTLWPVNDASTALLVSRFFQGHIQEGMRPAEALRAAQLWLRELSVSEYRDLLDAMLAAEPTHKAKQNLLELADALANVDPMSRPFAHPYHRGGFALHGA